MVIFKVRVMDKFMVMVMGRVRVSVMVRLEVMVMDGVAMIPISAFSFVFYNNNIDGDVLARTRLP